ncbi:MAG: YlxR family protein [Chloroflexi bacterium]|nr:YlxR family protein [Chloroflexota bacterium]
MTTNSKVIPAKHVPQRTCVVCRSTRDKKQLVRLVRSTQGNVQVDLTGRMAGRGAYLCREWQCWEAGLKRKRIEQALRGPLSNEDRDSLIEQAKGLFGKELIIGKSRETS